MRSTRMQACVYTVLAMGSVAWALAIDWLAGNASVFARAAATALAPSLVLVATPWIARWLAFASGPRLRSARALARTRSRSDKRGSSYVRAVSWSALLASVTVVVVEWGPRKTFLGRVFAVETGMSVDEVEAIMAGYMRGAGPAWQLPATDPLVGDAATETELAQASSEAYREPDHGGSRERQRFTGVMLYRWSNDARFNADWGDIRFVDGRVVSVKFWPD